MSHLLDTLDIASSADGLLVVRADGGAWRALREVHAAMAGMRGRGLPPHLTFVHPLAADGRMVDAQDPEAVVFVLGYRLGPREELPPLAPGGFFRLTDG